MSDMRNLAKNRLQIMDGSTYPLYIALGYKYHSDLVVNSLVSVIGSTGREFQNMSQMISPLVL